MVSYLKHFLALPLLMMKLNFKPWSTTILSKFPHVVKKKSWSSSSVGIFVVKNNHGCRHITLVSHIYALFHSLFLPIMYWKLHNSFLNIIYAFKKFHGSPFSSISWVVFLSTPLTMVANLEVSNITCRGKKGEHINISKPCCYNKKKSKWCIQLKLRNLLPHE